MSRQHPQNMLLFLVLAVNSDRFGITPSYSSRLFLSSLACDYNNALLTEQTSVVQGAEESDDVSFSCYTHGIPSTLCLFIHVAVM